MARFFGTGTAFPFGKPIEGDDGEVFVSAAGPGGMRVLLRFFNGAWKEVYAADAKLLKGWRGPDGKVWVQKDRKVIQLDEGVRSGDAGTEKAIAGLVTAVVSEPDHSFWLGTSAGVARYAPPLWRTPREIAWADGAVSAITSDGQGRVWFLEGQYLVVNEHGKWTRFQMPSGAADAVLTDNIVALESGELAIRGNSLANLVVFNPRSKKFRVGSRSPGKKNRVDGETGGTGHSGYRFSRRTARIGTSMCSMARSLRGAVIPRWLNSRI